MLSSRELEKARRIRNPDAEPWGAGKKVEGSDIQRLSGGELGKSWKDKKSRCCGLGRDQDNTGRNLRQDWEKTVTRLGDLRNRDGYSPQTLFLNS